MQVHGCQFRISDLHLRARKTIIVTDEEVGRYDASMSNVEELERKYALLFPHLNERQQHLVAAFDGQQLGRGGIALVSRVTGFSRPTIYRAIEGLSQHPLPVERVRHSGAGRKALAQHDPRLVQ